MPTIDQERMQNRWWRIEHLYKIQTKIPGLKKLLKLNAIQKKIKEQLMIWSLILILKARQEGVSTFCLIYHLDKTLFNRNYTTVILAHKRDSLKKLFRIIKIAYESCPDSFTFADGRVWNKPKAKYDNVNELYFEESDSRIYVALEVRSDTIHGLHVSEWAHIKDAENALTATLNAVVEGGDVTGETTANGVGGNFYEAWEDAIAGLSDYIALFFGFQDHSDYCDDIEDEDKFKKTLSHEEKKLLGVPNMKLGNIAWRRRKLRDPSRRKKFKQEFPCTAEEAFLTTGKSPFDREKIMDWVIRKPIVTKMEGRLKYWVRPIKDRRYLVSVDCASGAGAEQLDGEGAEGGTDYTSIGVWDCKTLQKVCAFRGKWPYAKVHQIAYRLGMEYNTAYIAIEATDHGLTVINNLVEHVRLDGVSYPHGMIHTTESVDHKSKKLQTKWGWYTNLKTKPLIIDHLAQLIDEEEVKIYDKIAQQEFLRFIIDDKGKYCAMEGYKDDTVMESAIGLYLIPNALRAGRGTATKSELGLDSM